MENENENDSSCITVLAVVWGGVWDLAWGVFLHKTFKKEKNEKCIQSCQTVGIGGEGGFCGDLFNKVFCPRRTLLPVFVVCMFCSVCVCVCLRVCVRVSVRVCV